MKQFWGYFESKILWNIRYFVKSTGIVYQSDSQCTFMRSNRVLNRVNSQIFFYSWSLPSKWPFEMKMANHRNRWNHEISRIFLTRIFFWPGIFLTVYFWRCSLRRVVTIFVDHDIKMEQKKIQTLNLQILFH